jgi:Cytochrome b subunit of formate dehydrogenase
LKKAVKITLDIIMTIIYIILMDINITGVLWHELLGLFIFGLFIVHNLLNKQWIRSVASSFIKSRAKMKFMFILDILLLVFMSITIVSGILISRSLFPFLASNNIGLWSSLHTSFSFSSLILISIHLGLHWKSVLLAVRRKFLIVNESRLRTVVLRSVAVLLMIIGIKNSFSKEMGEKILLPFTNTKTERLSVYNTSKTNIYNDSNTVLNTKLVSADALSLDSGTSLEDYLGSLICTACGRHCSLLSPRCGRGVNQAQQAEYEYNAAQNQTEDSNTSDEYNDNSQGEGDSADDGFFQNDNGQDNPISENDTKNTSGNIAGFIPVMSLYVAGTYYIVEFVEKSKRK